MFVFLGGYATTALSARAEKEYSEKEYIEKLQQFNNNAQWHNAVSTTEKLLEHYSTSPQGSLYLLEKAYAQYQEGEFPAAAETARRYEVLYPHEPHRDYARYLQALSCYQQSQGFLLRHWGYRSEADDVNKLEATQAVLEGFLQEYPTSVYFGDSHQMLTSVNHRLSQYHRRVAESYFGRRAYLAALSRLGNALEVVNEHGEFRVILQQMHRIYKILNWHQEADATQQILALNWAEKSRT